MENCWKDIWSKKSTEHNLEMLGEYEMFCELKRADGFDVGVEDADGYYQYFYKQLDEMVATIGRLMDPVRPASAFEVGCGSGVNLWFLQKHFGMEIGGIDYSASLADVANSVLKGNVVACKEAIELTSLPQYDVVFSNSVFQYFPDEAYAAKVLELMLQKSRRMVVLLEVHDMEHKDDWLAHRRSKIPDYDAQYAGLGRLFLSKKWVEEIAGVHGRQVHFTYPDSPYYVGSKYIYDAYLY
ncbi:MAG: class I SAM-dependent methyltransferase [Lachnospiraceae bacterium]|nr:class I SAM-dependent methyltransferase [Lachnospiraceae bacterium]